VRPRCAFYHSSLESSVETLRAEVPTIERWICLDGGSAHGEDFAAIAAGDHEHASRWIDASANRDRPVFYWSTSGSTGEPKVVVEDVVTFDGALMLIRRLQEGDRTHPVSLVIAPLTHGGGPHSFGVLTLGGTVIVPRHFDAQAVLATIERERVTDMWLPPTALYLLLESPESRKRDLSSLRHVRLGTAAVAPGRIKEAIDLFGPCISQTYGQIETGFISALDARTSAELAAAGAIECLGSAGRTVHVNRTAIMADDGRLLPPGETGEIVVRGRGVKRYLDDDATRQARRFGWHHTGDVGYFDEQGLLYIVGRIKDVVNMAGVKIPAPEIEAVILELPEIGACAVVAAPDPLRGEVPHAIVTGKAGVTVDAEAVLAHCRRRLGLARAPARVEQWPELPRSAAGKIDKLKIRAQATVAL
jgi:fatty-acyl-CoA synthase